MRNLFVKSLVVAFAGPLMMVGSALASPISGDYFTITDNNTDTYLTTFVWGPTTDSLYFAQNGGSFGFYTIDTEGDISNPTRKVEHELNVIPDSSGQVFFRQDVNLDWFVDYDNDATNGDKGAFYNVFGFFFSDTTGTYYTDSLLNAANVDPINIDYNPVNANLSFDYTLGGKTGTVQVTTHDVAPVPEPATMLLLGTGLVGLAGVARRRKAKK